MEDIKNELGSLTEEVPTIWGSKVTDRPTIGRILACSVG